TLGLSHRFAAAPTALKPALRYQPRKGVDTSGFSWVMHNVQPWGPDASLQTVSDRWRHPGHRIIDQIDRDLARGMSADMKVAALLTKATMHNYEGEPVRALEVLGQARTQVEADDALAEQWLFTVVY